MDWESLPTKRDPKVVEYLDFGYGSKWGNLYQNYNWSAPKKTKSKSKVSYLGALEPRDLYDLSYKDMLDLAYDDPETFVTLVRQELFNEPLFTSDDNSDDCFYFDHTERY